MSINTMVVYVKIEAADFYSENISYVNDWGVDSQKGRKLWQ